MPKILFDLGTPVDDVYIALWCAKKCRFFSSLSSPYDSAKRSDQTEMKNIMENLFLRAKCYVI